MIPLDSQILKKYYEDSNINNPNLSIFLAGSSVLHKYMESIGKNPSWTPNDSDLWVSFPTLNLNDNKYVKYSNKEKIKPFMQYTKDYFVQNGFTTYIPAFLTRLDYNNKQSISYKYIINIMYLEKDNNKLQIIFISKINDIQTFLNTYDLSICSIAWDIKNQTYIADDIVKKGIEKNLMWKQTHGTLERFNKYKNRGFEFIELNSQAYNIIDSYFPTKNIDSYQYRHYISYLLNDNKLLNGLFIKLNNNITLFMYQENNKNLFSKYNTNILFITDELQNIREWKTYDKNEFKFIFQQYIITDIYIMREKPLIHNNHKYTYDINNNKYIFVSIFNRENYKKQLIEKIIRKTKKFIEIIYHPIRLFKQGYFNIVDEDPIFFRTNKSAICISESDVKIEINSSD